MDCTQVRDLLHAYSDNELDALASKQLQDHLLQCPACDQAFAADRAVKQAIGQPGLYQPAPAALRRQFLAMDAPPGAAWRKMLAAAAIFIVAAGLGLFCAVAFSRYQADNRDADEALAAHLRSLQSENHEMDVASTDQHTVKPFFAGRLDFSPPVRDLSPQGFVLIGGRLDYLHDRPVAALVYRRNKHLINLFIWPGETGQSEATKQGYHLIHWSQGDMTFWAVSDLNAADLAQFESIFRAQ